MLKRVVITLFLSSASLVLLASVAIHPAGAVKFAHSYEPILTGAEIDPQVLATLERSCQNCHSEKTAWPWYSYIAPLSWLVERDVVQARSHLNLSRWSEYTPSEKQQLLARIGAVIRSGKMPPARYTALHREAKISPEEGARIYEWAHAERRRLRSTTPPVTGGGFQRTRIRAH